MGAPINVAAAGAPPASGSLVKGNYRLRIRASGFLLLQVS
jgi:hypothetical protein